MFAPHTPKQNHLLAALPRAGYGRLLALVQTAICNRHHSVERQSYRGLLLSLDRLRSNVLTMIQEPITYMLGARREGVADDAGNLQATGSIRYSRGRITVPERPNLEAPVCECHAVVKRNSDRLPFRGTAMVGLLS